jgi:DNA-binding transcriptional MerR regulator
MRGMAKAAAAARSEAPQDDLRGINRMAKELGITSRTIRFYEDKGLVEPQRVGTTRIYTKREFARMQLILRGKRLGFSLREIKEFLDLYDVDALHLEQMRLLAGRVSERLAELRHQRAAIEQTIKELEDIEQETLARIMQAQ